MPISTYALNGCHGSIPSTAMNWMSKFGVPSEASYPFASGNGIVVTC